MPNAHCELCSAQQDLAAYPLAEDSVTLCLICREYVEQPGAVDVKHWYGLKESIWSEHAGVKILAYRVLKRLPGHPWALDLLDQIYLDEEQQTLADAGLSPVTEEAALKFFDSNGTELKEGDTVTLIKDLEVKGANFTAKRGTTVKNISLTDDPKFIEGRVNGVRIVLVTAYLKKA